VEGIDPYAYLQQVGSALDRLRERREIEVVLDELEYLYEVLDPELQHLADDLIGQLRRRLDETR
jgi:hypothetical protein